MNYDLDLEYDSEYDPDDSDTDIYLGVPDTDPKTYKLEHEDIFRSDSPIVSKYMLRPRKRKKIIFSMEMKDEEKSPELKSPELTPNKYLDICPHSCRTIDDIVIISRLDCEKWKNCQRFKKILPIIEKINNLIGLNNFKDMVFRFIMFNTKRNVFKTDDYHNLILTGSPGMGKTTCASLFAELLCAMSFVENADIVHGNRRNMIGEYVGTTSKKVWELVETAAGKVLFIDEAYSLRDGSASEDSYGKAALETIIQAIDKYRHNTVFIMSGYKNDIQHHIMSSNPGLDRRFPWRLHIDPYNASEMRRIYIKMVSDAGFINFSIPCEKWWKENILEFPSFGGSIANFIYQLKLEWSIQNFFNDSDIPSFDDNIFNAAFSNFKNIK
jgi:stage V sporulation protein K